MGYRLSEMWQPVLGLVELERQVNESKGEFLVNGRYSEVARQTHFKNVYKRQATIRGWVSALLSLVVGALLVLLVVPANAAEVSSVRSSQHEWQCEDSAGTKISGHTRQDKAFQSCMNQALATGQTYFVRGGTFRVTASGSTVSPPEPPDPVPPPDPEPPVPGESPQVTFGPASSIIQFPNTISALAQDAVRWQLTFTMNSTTGIQGLASRDENGQRDPGHLSIWVDNGTLTVRHQGTSQSVQIEATTLIQAGVEYVAIISVEAGVGIGIQLDGVLEAQAVEAWGLAGNDLPLTLAGLCSRCNDPLDATRGPDRPIDGSVALAIYDLPLVLPAPVAVMLNWINPTEDEDGQALPAGIPSRISIYRTSGGRSLVSHLDGESTAYEVTGLALGNHCFTATAWNINSQSLDSNEVCKVAQ